MHSRSQDGIGRCSFYYEACAIGAKMVIIKGGDKPGRKIREDKGTKTQKSRELTGYGEAPA